METSRRARRFANRVGAASAMVSLLPVILLDGCTVYGRETRSIPAVVPGEAAVVHACPSTPKLWYSPPSGGTLCFLSKGVEAEVEANNRETTFLALGPLLPLVPISSGEAPVSSRRLGVDLAFRSDVSYAFFPWRVSIRTAHGETLGVSQVATNVRDSGAVHTETIDPGDQEARRLSPEYSRFFLTFEKPVVPDQEFSLTFDLIAPDGSGVQLPRITFKKGKLSYLAAIP